MPNYISTRLNQNSFFMASNRLKFSRYFASTRRLCSCRSLNGEMPTVSPSNRSFAGVAWPQTSECCVVHHFHCCAPFLYLTTINPMLQLIFCIFGKCGVSESVVPHILPQPPPPSTDQVCGSQQHFQVQAVSSFSLRIGRSNFSGRS